MIKEKITEILMEIPEKFKGITKAHFEYYKAATYEQFAVIVSGVSILAILFFLFSLFFVFLTFGIAFYIGSILGNYAWGFLILAVFYLLGGILVYVKRGPLIINPVVKILEMIFYSDQGIFDKLTKKEGEVEDENEEA